MELTYKGEKLPVNISYYVIKKYKEETGNSISQSNISGDNLEPLEIILYYALIAGHNKEGKEFKYKREEVEFILDACLIEFMDLFNNSWPDQKQGQAKKK